MGMKRPPATPKPVKNMGFRPSITTPMPVFTYPGKCVANCCTTQLKDIRANPYCSMDCAIWDYAFNPERAMSKINQCIDEEIKYEKDIEVQHNVRLACDIVLIWVIISVLVDIAMQIIHHGYFKIL